jgi:HK97 family phage portal protein
MTEENKPHSFTERLTSALANFRGEDNPARHNVLGLEPTEAKGASSSSGARHYGYDGGYGTNFERIFQSMFGRYQGSRIDYSREIGDPTQSSLVMAAVNWLGRTLPEAPLEVVEKMADGKTNIIQDHEATLLLQQPNDFYTGELLWMCFAMSWIIDGNVYLWKIRNALGQVIQLWWLPHFLVEPRYPMGDDSVFISHYAYLINGVEWDIPAEDIIHFRNGIDPTNTRKGLSDLASLLREIYGDNEASNCSAVLMKNCGIFPFVVSPKANVDNVDVDLTKVKEEFVRKTTGDERGKPIVNGIGVDVQKMAFSPKELDMKALRRLPEERVAAVIGIPAIVLGFGAGLDRATYANFAEAREAAYESYVIPLERIIAGQLNLQLMGDKQARLRKSKGEKLRHDLTQVRVLQDDQNKLYARLSTAYQGDWMKLSEVRSAAGLKTGPKEDVYKSELASQNGDGSTGGTNKPPSSDKPASKPAED